MPKIYYVLILIPLTIFVLFYRFCLFQPPPPPPPHTFYFFLSNFQCILSVSRIQTSEAHDAFEAMSYLNLLGKDATVRIEFCFDFSFKVIANSNVLFV